jgi:hypothetical protein
MNKKDVQLLSEAYSVQLLKENFPNLTLRQVVENYDRYNMSEQAWVDEFSERVIEELFGGVGALAKGMGRGISGMAKGLGNAAMGAAKGAGNVAKGVAKGTGSAAGQFGKNVKNIYNTAEGERSMSKGVEKGKKLAGQLQGLIQNAVSQGYLALERDQDPMDMPLRELIDALMFASEGASDVSQGFQDSGAFKNVGRAFNKGFNQ